jgi:hypothetical protein
MRSMSRPEVVKAMIEMSKEIMGEDDDTAGVAS